MREIDDTDLSGSDLDGAAAELAPPPAADHQCESISIAAVDKDMIESSGEAHRRRLTVADYEAAQKPGIVVNMELARGRSIGDFDIVATRDFPPSRGSFGLRKVAAVEMEMGNSRCCGFQ